MDDLLSVLLMIGIAGFSVWKKQKKQAEQAAKQAQKKRAFSDLAEMEMVNKPSPKGKPAKTPEQETEGSLPQKAAVSPKPAARAPIAKEVLAQFLHELNDQVSEGTPAPIPAKAEQIKMDLHPPRLPVKPTSKQPPAPLLFMDHDEPEGSVSTQGESLEEHAMHRQKILAEEANIRLEQEARQEIRNLNLQKLREAVIMSEILDKPVSLRRRRTF